MILVTGGSGFIGTNLLCYLSLTAKEEIVSADIAKPPFRLDNVEYIQRDVTQFDNFCSDQEISTIYHLAAKAGVDCGYREAIHNNILGTAMVGGFARQVGAHVVFASSGAVEVVGRGPVSTYDSSSAYGISKQAGESILQTMVARDNLSASILRFSNVYGWQPQGKSVVFNLLREAMRPPARPVLTGSGMQTRDLIHVFDVVSACVVAAKNHHCGDVVDVGTGVQTSMRDLWRQCLEATGGEWANPMYSALEFAGPARQVYSNHSCLMPTVPWWRAAVSLTQGLRATRDYLQSMLYDGAGAELVLEYWKGYKEALHLTGQQSLTIS